MKKHQNMCKKGSIAPRIEIVDINSEHKKIYAQIFNNFVKKWGATIKKLKKIKEQRLCKAQKLRDKVCIKTGEN